MTSLMEPTTRLPLPLTSSLATKILVDSTDIWRNDHFSPPGLRQLKRTQSVRSADRPDRLDSASKPDARDRCGVNGSTNSLGTPHPVNVPLGPNFERRWACATCVELSRTLHTEGRPVGSF